MPCSMEGSALRGERREDRAAPSVGPLQIDKLSTALGTDDKRVPALLAAATRHRDAALPAVTGEHYEGGHWLGTFAVYLTSDAWLH